jgi:GT2 family glycosyltransferase
VILGMFGVAGHAYWGAPRGTTGHIARAALEQDLSCVTAACMVVRREAFEGLQGLNETLGVRFNDVDFCVRLRKAGWRIIWTPFVEHYHHESATLGNDQKDRPEEFRAEVELMRKWWAEELDNDPFHNPNLSLRNNHIGFAYPRRLPKLPQLA